MPGRGPSEQQLQLQPGEVWVVDEPTRKSFAPDLVEHAARHLNHRVLRQGIALERVECPQGMHGIRGKGVLDAVLDSHSLDCLSRTETQSVSRSTSTNSSAMSAGRVFAPPIPAELRIVNADALMGKAPGVGMYGNVMGARWVARARISRRSASDALL